MSALRITVLLLAFPLIVGCIEPEPLCGDDSDGVATSLSGASWLQEVPDDEVGDDDAGDDDVADDDDDSGDDDSSEAGAGARSARANEVLQYPMGVDMVVEGVASDAADWPIRSVDVRVERLNDSADPVPFAATPADGSDYGRWMATIPSGFLRLRGDGSPAEPGDWVGIVARGQDYCRDHQDLHLPLHVELVDTEAEAD